MKSICYLSVMLCILLMSCDGHKSYSYPVSSDNSYNQETNSASADNLSNVDESNVDNSNQQTYVNTNVNPVTDDASEFTAQSEPSPRIETCTTCNGSGVCPVCNGEGEYNVGEYIGEYEPRVCQYCYGTGKCPSCEGSGVKVWE